jgi:SPX domain protein involved in polyphosphate accumulation
MVQFGDLLQSKSAEYTAIVPPESFLDYEKLKGIIKAKKQELKKKEGVEIDATDFFDAIDFEVKKIRDFIHNLSIGEDDLCSCTAGAPI